ncbi:uncharacterized protein LOC106138443 [Amyelois transitella]|uniref:uncharacterized protein LOC106138443 n=1 Tax=Amyelois transitella TaxID=680683 RepID=UPI00298F45C4|nr:uncharacterized protein LOC106138443 [Amyelois transitella]
MKESISSGGSMQALPPSSTCSTALLELIEASKIITCKTTNATNNKLKNEEWNRIAVRFNASVTVCRRTTQQLRLKWENLKKNARKRSTNEINLSYFPGGPGDYIPPDEILDRVTSLLGSTATGFEVPFGGDRDMDCGDDGGCNEGDSSREGGVGGEAQIIDIYFDPKPGTSTDINNETPVLNRKVYAVEEDIPISKPRKVLFSTLKPRIH